MLARLILWAVIGYSVAACTSEPWGCGMNAACPALADINGIRYGVSGAVDLPGIEEHLSPFAVISDTNMDGAFADNTALAIEAIDARALLIVRNNDGPDNEPGDFRELWSLSDEGASPWPAFCRFMTPDRQAAQPECH